MTELFNQKATIYNVCNGYYRYVINNCNIQTSITDKSSETISNSVGAITLTTKDISNFKQSHEFSLLEDKSGYFTATNGDFVVLGECLTEVSTPIGFKNLQLENKNGFKVLNVGIFLYGTPNDNVTMTNVRGE